MNARSYASTTVRGTIIANVQIGEPELEPIVDNFSTTYRPNDPFVYSSLPSLRGGIFGSGISSNSRIFELLIDSYPWCSRQTGNSDVNTPYAVKFNFGLSQLLFEKAEAVLDNFEYSDFSPKEEIMEYIARNAELLPLLSKISVVLKDYLEFQGLRLRLMHDMENPVIEELVLFVIVQGSVDDIEDRMDLFFEEWWLPNPAFSDGKLAITTEYL